MTQLKKEEFKPTFRPAATLICDLCGKEIHGPIIGRYTQDQKKLNWRHQECDLAVGDKTGS